MSSLGLAASLVVGAFLLSLSHRSASHAWVGWFSLVPLFLAIRLWRPFGAALAGALLGVGLYVFSAGHPEGTIPAAVGSLLFLAAIPATYACLGSWLTRRIGFSPLVLGVGWMAVELAFEPLGVRNGLLAAGEGDGSFIHWVGGALGYVLAAFVVAFVNASLVCLLSVVHPIAPPGAYAIGEDDGRGRLIPQTPPSLPVLATGSVQPRAPPWPVIPRPNCWRKASA